MSCRLSLMLSLLAFSPALTVPCNAEPICDCALLSCTLHCRHERWRERCHRLFPYPPLNAQVEAEGDVATAFTLARILSDIPLSRGGPTSVVIFDIHALQERFYFGDTVLPLFESGIPLLRARLKSLPDADNVTIAYPDEGAWKRFHYQFGDYPEVCPAQPRPHLKTTATLRNHTWLCARMHTTHGCVLACTTPRLRTTAPAHCR